MMSMLPSDCHKENFQDIAFNSSQYELAEKVKKYLLTLMSELLRIFKNIFCKK